MNQTTGDDRQTAQLWVGTVAAVLAVGLPLLASSVSGIDTSTSFVTDNWAELRDSQQAERLAATLHVLGLLATIALIGVVAARIREAYPSFGMAAGNVFVLAGAGFVLLRSIGPLGVASLTLLDAGSPLYEPSVRVLEALVMIAGPASLLFAALAACSVAIAGMIEDVVDGLGHLVIGVVLLALGSVSLILDRDPEDRWADHTFTRPGGPLTTAGLLLVALWAIWLARRPKLG